jgi:hypothetical protein
VLERRKVIVGSRNASFLDFDRHSMAAMIPIADFGRVECPNESSGSCLDLWLAFAVARCYRQDEVCWSASKRESVDRDTLEVHLAKGVECHVELLFLDDFRNQDMKSVLRSTRVQDTRQLHLPTGETEGERQNVELSKALRTHIQEETRKAEHVHVKFQMPLSILKAMSASGCRVALFQFVYQARFEVEYRVGG